MTLAVLYGVLTILLAQAADAKMSTMKLKAPGSTSTTFHALSVGSSSNSTATSAKPGELLATDKQRYSNLLDQVSVAKIAPAWRSKTKRQATSASASASTVVSQGTDQNGDEDVTATNNVVFYSIDVGVGANGDVHELLVDTGSSNTWIGSLTAYQETSTSKDTGSNFSVSYGSGQVAGAEFEDLLTIGDLTLQGQSIGVAQQASGFETSDGIIGIGPTGLTRGTLSNSNQSIPTVIDTLFDQGEIDDPMIGVFFAPSEAVRSNNGMLTFGGMDPALVQGNLIQAQRTQTSPANQYWGVDMSFSLGDNTFGKKTAGITDTGTTLIMIADDYFEAYAEQLSSLGGNVDSSTGLVRIPSNRVDQVPTMNFGLDSGTLSLIADAQFFPESLNPSLGITGDDGFRYSVIASLGTQSGSGLDFIWGMKALERFVTGYDSRTGAINLGQTAFTGVRYSDLSAAITKFEAAEGEEAAEPSIIGATSVEEEEEQSSGAAAVRVALLAVILVATHTWLGYL